jgi:muramoyltetrapeptide carboxypeptidase
MRGAARTKPRALRAGDVVGIAAPAGPVSEERLERGIAELQSLGLAVVVGEGVLARSGFTAGSAEARLAQLHALYADPDVRAIVCARGGAGTAHVLPGLDRELLSADPKLVLGYSDVTALHLLLDSFGITSLHGPMVAWELADGVPSYDRASLWHGLTGEGSPWASASGEIAPLRSGSAEGVLCGGCLSLLAASVGTPWALETKEPSILFIEDVDERPYRVDRMLRQLRLSGALAGVRGIVFGEMKGCQAGAEDGYTLHDVLLSALEGLEVPVAVGLPSGHATRPNVTLPLGVRTRLECGDGEARLVVEEAAVQ